MSRARPRGVTLITPLCSRPCVVRGNRKRAATPARERTGSVSDTTRGPRRPRGFLWENTRERIYSRSFEKLITRVRSCCALRYILLRTITRAYLRIIITRVRCVCEYTVVFAQSYGSDAFTRIAFSAGSFAFARAMSGKNYTVHYNARGVGGRASSSLNKITRLPYLQVYGRTYSLASCPWTWTCRELRSDPMSWWSASTLGRGWVRRGTWRYWWDESPAVVRRWPTSAGRGCLQINLHRVTQTRYSGFGVFAHRYCSSLTRE